MAESDKNFRIIIVGAGIFGVASAWELKKRGHDVSLFDPGPIPHPLASTTDISKAIRFDYGADEFYMAMMEEAIVGWRAWNLIFDEPLYHEDGLILISTDKMMPGGFEHDSYHLQRKRGHHPERLNGGRLAERFPAWNSQRYPDGYFNPVGGWAESGKVLSALTRLAAAEGVAVHEGQAFKTLLEDGSRVTGIETNEGRKYSADYVLISAGAWTPVVLPDLKDRMWPVAQPVFHFGVGETRKYHAPKFTVWTADIARTGWYGFPAKQDGVLKIANHGVGWRISPNGSREIPSGTEDVFREFLAGTFPDIADAPLLATRLCFYCDTWDGDLWIDHDPDRKGLLVVSGGSGHGFKFAPLLGALAADILEGKSNPYAGRFSWRSPKERRKEDARFLG